MHTSLTVIAVDGYPVFKVVDKRDLHADLCDGDAAVDDVQLVGIVFQVAVERPRDDGEDHVEEREDRRKSQQR